MKTLFPVLLLALALPLNAQLRGGVRAGAYQGYFTGTAELEARHGNWSLAPAIDITRGGYDLHAWHIDVRRLFIFERQLLWIGAGPTYVRTNDQGKEDTWNVDAGWAWRLGAWEPYVAARYYTYEFPVFRDTVKGDGGTVSIGISRRF